jgi:hypothetical protein
MDGAPQNDTEKFCRKQKNPKLYQIIHFLRLTHTVDKYLFAGIIYAENVYNSATETKQRYGNCVYYYVPLLLLRIYKDERFAPWIMIH